MTHATQKQMSQVPRTVFAALAMAIVAALFLAPAAGAAIEIESFEFDVTDPGGAATHQAASHPEQVTTPFVFPKDDEELPVEQPRNLSVALPAGLVGNPTAIPTCTEAQLNSLECSNDSAIGFVELQVPSAGLPPLSLPIYDLEAPPGVPGQFGFNILGVTVHLTAEILTANDYRIAITLRHLPQTLPYTAVSTTFWGVPADPSHDSMRGTCLTLFGPSGGSCPSTLTGDEIRPFLTNPTSCPETLTADARVDSWGASGVFATAAASNEEGGEPVAIDGCELPEFDPTLEARPTTNVADSPSGLHLRIGLPVNEDPDGLAQAHLKDTELVFPPGMTVNTASAAGLEGCTTEQAGLTSAVGDPVASFDDADVACPPASKLGKVEIDTPLLDDPLEGAVYLATPHSNPFGSLLALYIVVEDPRTGVLIKLAGQPQPDPATGRLTVSFDRNPQLPFEAFRIDMFPGARAAFKTPLSCGPYSTASTMTPWSSPQGADRHPVDNFDVSAAPGGGPCPTSDANAPNAPALNAGTQNPAAGKYSPFVLKVTRADGTQPIRSIEATLPKGLLGKLAGIPYCSDDALTAAAAHSGRAEQGSASCPAASQVGNVQVSTGAGPSPLAISGKAYLAGPYKGAPLSLAIVTPAVAGPFDLGDVVVRTALVVDPETTQIRAISDPMPTILEGIPLDIRSLAVRLDREDFTFNPTSCKPDSIFGSAVSAFGSPAPLSTPFRIGGCNALRFKPKLKLRLRGGTNRRGHPALRAVLTNPQGNLANIARAQVTLPGDQLLDNAHLGTVCTRPRLAAKDCPKASVYGFARAVTPLLDKPLQGPVYLSPGSHKLPDLVADLDGQIRVLLRGKVDSDRATGALRTTFTSVPDAPVSRFELRMRGGKRGLIQNSSNLCAAVQRAKVSFDAQNGRIADSKTKIRVACKKRGKGKRHGKR